jgi:hypothetical protein
MHHSFLYKSYRWYVPFTHSIEKIGVANPDILSLTTNNIWEKVIWFMPNETESIKNELENFTKFL